MMTLNSVVAREHRADLRRAADRGHLISAATRAGVREDTSLTLRLAQAQDAPAVHRLEDLDDTTPLAGRILLASQDSEVVAALSLTDGRVAANPFVPTEGAVALLRVRAAHLAEPSGRPLRRWRVTRRRRVNRRVRWA